MPSNVDLIPYSGDVVTPFEGQVNHIHALFFIFIMHVCAFDDGWPTHLLFLSICFLEFFTMQVSTGDLNLMSELLKNEIEDPILLTQLSPGGCLFPVVDGK